MNVTVDALGFLLLLEAAVALLGTTIFFVVRNGRNKRLYRKTLKELNDLKAGDEDADRRSLRDEVAAAAVEEGSGGDAEAEGATQYLGEPVAVAPSGDLRADDLALQEAEAPEQAETGIPEEESAPDASPGQVRRLQRMVVFQKKTILDLMCYKDMFESAQKRLTEMQQSSSDLEGMIKSLVETGGPEAGPLAGSLTVLESTSKELSAFITVLDKENEALSEKFRVWESELQSISEELESGGDGSAGPGIDEGRYAELMAEKEEMAARLKEVSEQLQEKSTMLNDLQKQYEDLEKEYMILYRQQQQGGGAG